MAISNANHQLALVVPSNTTTSYEGLLESQKELLSKQICELQNIVSRQCKLTGVNPLSQEMAAGALSIKIGKRPRDLLNPKAIKYMQSIFSVKDEISKKEIRAISALFGLTATQVRDFFTSQRSRVRRFIRISREKANQSSECVQNQDGPLSSNVDPLNHPVPLNSVGPSSVEAPSCSTQDEVLPDTDDSDKYFTANIFSLMRKEETFSGQVKLMEWILQIQNPSVLYWFLTNGGVMILASWLSEAAIEEQTSVLHVILRVLCHLPLHKALPAHMSAILQSVNKLRFYRVSDVSNRAKSLLSRWSKMFARSQAMRKPNANISAVDAQNEILLKQSIGEIMENESFHSRIENPAAIYSLLENSENSRSQSIKLLASPSDDSNMKLLKGVSSSHGKERRKVQLVEQPGQRAGGRGPQVTRLFPSAQGRPLSADDIQKAKIRAQFMRSKYGESYVGSHPHVKTEVPRVLMSATSSSSSSSSKAPVHPKVQPKVDEEKKELVKNEVQEVEEPAWKKCKSLLISWVNPPEMKMNKEWSVCYGENSKEVEVQNKRMKREKEVFYNTNLEIPANPKEPWDREMDYDDSLTPEIPTEQLPDEDDENMKMVTQEPTQTEAVTISENNKLSSIGPDLELLAVLLKNPQIVFALTAGQGGSLSNAQMVKLLDAMKANAASGGSIDSLVSGLLVDEPHKTKTEEKRVVEVSLPSPTPSTNPVTSGIGWRAGAESGKNQFSSRQSVTVNGDAYPIPRVHFQETSLLTHQQLHANAPITHHQRFTDVVPDQRNIPAPSNLTQQATSSQRNIHGVNTSSNAYFLPGVGGSHAWAGQESPYAPADHSSTNYNAYGTREAGPGPGPGPSWGRNSNSGGYHPRGFDSWSPEESPVRSREYDEREREREREDHSRRSYGYNYSNNRPEMLRMQNEHSRSRDRGGAGGGRNEASRWRVRRR
ncbi:unnamed protein product [Lactuca saligna]|uniref:Homeobox domain-containing protein n=1 Tax=Lactuca saligna TaxID=75948 RepID=A0AA35ZQU2_LACSI|nr:unnamed protein product [Lactuca saligna]